MLYHVPDRSQALSEIRRVLKSNGRFYAATNGQSHLQEIRKLVSRFAPELTTEASPFADRFGLENGQDQLALWFTKVILHRYPDSLVITEAQPLVDYILSSFESLRSRREALFGFIEEQLIAAGSLHIGKESGLFEALPGGYDE